MNKNDSVEQFMNDLEHSQKDAMMLIRDIVLSTDEKITEDIKWKAPTFIYKGNITSFIMNTKTSVSMMFHDGAKIEDDTGLLEGDGKKARVARFEDIADVTAKKSKLQKVIKKWIAIKDA